jgi:hypothetical protein
VCRSGWLDGRGRGGVRLRAVECLAVVLVWVGVSRRLGGGLACGSVCCGLGAMGLAKGGRAGRANWGKFLPVAHRALVVGFSPNVECLGLELLLYLSCVVGWYCVVFHKFVRVILQGRRQRGIMLTVLPVRWSAR